MEAAGQLDLESLVALTIQEGESMGGEYDDLEDDDNCFLEEPLQNTTAPDDND